MHPDFPNVGAKIKRIFCVAKLSPHFLLCQGLPNVNFGNDYLLNLTFTKFCKNLALQSKVAIFGREKTCLQGGMAKGAHNARECVPFGGI